MQRSKTPRPDRLAFVRRLLWVAALLAGARLAWVYETRYPVRAADDPPQTLIIPQGTSADAIGRELQSLGLVRHPFVFRAFVILRGQQGELKAGEYSFDGPLSLAQIVDQLARGEVVRHEVTFPEGKRFEDMAEIAAEHGIDAANFLAAARDPGLIKDIDPAATDLQGYLFPDTYDLPPGTKSAAALVARMVQRFRDLMVPELPRLGEAGFTLREAVTLASLVELETARPEERPRIAAVFRNRLQRKMLLQTDPTVIYALRNAGSWDGNIRKKDLEIDSPYNTYRFAGLPPGPIASPGRHSLLAVLHPAPGKDLYFVSRNDGTHVFSETLSQHEHAVDLYQRRRGPKGKGDS
jgi:peptidoglycan lytic transglycosylase G